MINETVLLFIIFVINETLKNFFEKQAVINSNVFNSIIGRYIFLGIITFGYLIFNYKQMNIINEIKTNRQYVKYIVISSICSLLAAYGSYNLFKKHDASYFISISMPLMIIGSIIFGLLFFNEPCNKYKLLGAFIASIGVFIVYKSEK